MDLSFYNQVIATLVETYGIKHILGTPHYPQSHGFIKRQHQGIIFFFFKKLPSTNPWYHHLSTTHALLGRSHTSEIHYNSCTTTAAITRRVICFPFRLINFVNVCIIIFFAKHMTAYQSQQQKIIFDKKTGRIDPL